MRDLIPGPGDHDLSRCGTRSQDPNGLSRRQTLNRLSHPDAPGWGLLTASPGSPGTCRAVSYTAVAALSGSHSSCLGAFSCREPGSRRQLVPVHPHSSKETVGDGEPFWFCYF